MLRLSNRRIRWRASVQLPDDRGAYRGHGQSCQGKCGRKIMSNTYLGPDNIDDLGRMVTALLTELWITRDRVAVLEQLLEDKKIVLPGEVDDYIPRSEEHTSELQSLMRISYAVFCLTKNTGHDDQVNT